MSDEKKKINEGGFTIEKNVTFAGMPGFTKITIDPGDHVNCDYCNEEYMDSDEKGGILFGSKAICPKCTPRALEGIKKYGKEDYIRDRARDGESFRDFVYRLRKR